MDEIQHWANAPVNDLQFFQDLFAYRDIDHDVAEVVIRKLEDQCWCRHSGKCSFSTVQQTARDNKQGEAGYSIKVFGHCCAGPFSLGQTSIAESQH